MSWNLKESELKLSREIMKISLLHATKNRVELAKACQKMWLDYADDRSRIEIITAVDADDAESIAAFPDAVIVSGTEGCCPAYNAAAAKATGDFLINLDEDWIPAHAYDTIIESYVCNGADILHVGDQIRKDDLMCHQVISRKFYETIGYFHHPLFKSVYSDNWATTLAKNWGFVDATKGGTVDLGFLHANPSRGLTPEDEVARKSNSRERYAHGEAVFKRLTEDQVVLAFTAYDRVEYLKETLDSWLKTNLELVTSIQFFIEPSERLSEIIAVIDAFAAQTKVPVIKHVNPERYGVLRNPWELFHNLFDKQLAHQVILAEDDFIVSSDVLTLFDELRKQANDKTLAICAKWVGKDADKNPSTWKRTIEFTGNIWSASREAWNTYLKKSWDADYSSGNADGTPSGWDWNIGLRILPQNDLHCIVPTASRSRHVGKIGAHCTEEVFAETVAWNFLDTPYHGKYKPHCEVLVAETYTPPKEVIGKAVTSVGDIGDIIMSLATLVGAGYYITYYLFNNGQSKGIVDRESVIRPLLESQPCIKEVKIYNGEDVDWHSEGFRSGWVDKKRSLALCHAQHALDTNFIASLPDVSKPWLFNIDTDSRADGRIIVNASPRYRNPTFQWQEVVNHYGSRLMFVGLPIERADFCSNYGEVEYVPTSNMLEVARLIQGSLLFIGNQSSAMTIAEGLKHPRILEGSLSIPDCCYSGASNAQYVFDGSMILPDISGSGEKHIKSKAFNWTSFDLSIVPKVGRHHGWLYQHGDVMLQESVVNKLAKKLGNLTGWTERDCLEKIVTFTVKSDPASFAGKLDMNRFHTAKLALQAVGITDHPLLNLMSGKLENIF